jgi:hypothetical protein
MYILIGLFHIEVSLVLKSKSYLTLRIPLQYGFPIGAIGDRSFTQSCSNIRSALDLRERSH